MCNISKPLHDLPIALDDLAEVLAEAGGRPAIFLDYDGTLTPIVERPEDAVLAEETREIVRRLAERYPVIVVSGRGREDVARLVGLPELIYAGSHGLDIRGPEEEGGKALRHEPAREAEPAIRAVTRALEARLSEVPGTQVEPKRFSVAIHYRRVPDDRLAEVEAAVDAELAAHSKRSPGLRKAHGKKVYELRPDLDWDKGKAVLWLLEALDLDRPDVVPVYIGDDVTDEDAFRALAERDRGPGRPGGIGVLVAEEPRATAARYRLRDPEAVRGVLERLARVPETERESDERPTGEP